MGSEEKKGAQLKEETQRKESLLQSPKKQQQEA